MRRPSTALVVATAAIVVATTGSAVAAKHYLITSSSQVKPGAIALTNLSAKARKALKGQTGPRGLAGTPGTPGTPGAPGLDGTARAYGFVGSTGRSKNVVSVTNPAVGEFCVTLAPGIDTTTTGLVATPDSSSDTTGTNSQAVVEWRSSGAGCSTGTLDIKTYNETVTASGLVLTPKNQGFFFVVP